MHWSQSVSTSKFSLGRYSPSVPRKTQATFLGPEFRVPFHLVKNQVEVFRCEAHISLLGMLISGWAAISIFESSWGGASKSCLALRKRRRNWALTSIFWLALCFSLYVFSFSHPFAPLSFSLSFFFLFLSCLSCPFTSLFAFFLTSPSYSPFLFCLPLFALFLPSFLNFCFLYLCFWKKQTRN